MRVIGVVALVLAILLFLLAGTLGVARWLPSVVSTDILTKVLGENATSVTDTLNSVCKELYIDLPSLFVVIAASAAFFVIAIISFAIANAIKKKAIQASYNKVKKSNKNGNSVNQAIPVLAAGVLVTAALVAASVVLKGQANRDDDDCCCCHCRRH